MYVLYEVCSRPGTGSGFGIGPWALKIGAISRPKYRAEPCRDRVGRTETYPERSKAAPASLDLCAAKTSREGSLEAFRRGNGGYSSKGGAV